MFHVTTKSRYGLRTLVELAMRSGTKPVSLSRLSSCEDASKKYLENIFRMFNKNGIIRSVRGARGGYQLIRHPENLTVFDILDAAEGPIELLDCVSNKATCKKVDKCPTREFWCDLENAIVTFLKSKTLKDLIDVARKSKGCFQGMYI